MRLNAAVIRALLNHVRDAHANMAVKAIVLTGANGNLTAGFDITQFKHAGENTLGVLCDAVESGPKPTVVAIDGLCLGGGLEISVACAGRVCTPESKLGLPEVHIGIIPGSGGTQRLPRLVGVKQGIEMMLTGRPITGAQARALGLVEAVAAKDFVVHAAKALAVEMAERRAPWLVTLRRTDRIEALGEAVETMEVARARMRRRARHLLHPQLCLDAVLAGIEHGGQAGLAKVRSCVNLNVGAIAPINFF